MMLQSSIQSEICQLLTAAIAVYDFFVKFMYLAVELNVVFSDFLEEYYVASAKLLTTKHVSVLEKAIHESFARDYSNWT